MKPKNFMTSLSHPTLRLRREKLDLAIKTAERLCAQQSRLIEAISDHGAHKEDSNGIDE